MKPDKIHTKTILGTDNVKDNPDFIKLNMLRGTIEEYNGFWGGIKLEATGMETGLEFIPLDTHSKNNNAGLSVGADIVEGVAKTGLYFENDFWQGGFISGGSGAAASAVEANVHAKIRIGKFNIYGNIGGDIGGVGGMIEGSICDKQSDGTYHILKADGVLEVILGINACVDVYIKDNE